MKQFRPPEYLNASNIYEVNIRQYTEEGTFAAFSRHLPRLHDMGVEILWLMPVHPIGIINRKGTLGSYYSISDHKNVNPEFGTREDFSALVSKAHGLGMKVILDWVANHTAWDHVWTKTNPEFYERDGECFKSPNDWTDVLQLDHNHTGQQEDMIDAMAYWIREFDIDGFRADLAHLTPLNFWIKARQQLTNIKHDLIWLAESEELSYHDAFDITFTWGWMHKAEQVARDKEDASTLTGFLRQDPMKGLRLYFTSNHDENSWNGTEYEKYGDYARALSVFSATYKSSVPLVYSGQELPLYKRLQFFEKDVIEWVPVCALQKFYRTLFQLRKRNSVYSDQGSDFRFLDYPGLLAYSLSNTADTVYVFINPGRAAVDFSFDKIQYGNYLNVFGENMQTLNDEFGNHLEPGEFLLLERVSQVQA